VIDDLDWIDSGERLVPAVSGGDVIEAEHLARYRLALPMVAGKVVLDAGCGVGWGSRLLLSAGPATQVVGVDNFPPAIDYACATYPGPTYQVGDITKLDLGDASVDVVVCFEALEHVHDHAAALAEFRRVLRPDGLLFVSSPNPGVYPAGNPYHVHEVPPGELRAEVSAVFPNTMVLRQELLIASIVESSAALEAADVVRIGVTDGPTDQYSVVVASAGPLPPIDGTLVLAPSHQLTHLDELGRALASERAEFAAAESAVASELDRLRDVGASADTYAAGLVEQIEDLNRQLVQAADALRSVMDERDELVERVLIAEARAATMSEELICERTANREIGQRQHLELDAVRRERDGLLVGRLWDEQSVARGDLPHSATSASCDVAELASSAQALADQLNAIRRSRSWRITAPLRRIRESQLRLTTLTARRGTRV
jgi:2-polyprenyl-3-methyl-5-hydroxy-6-metoxy-1,4-benzoquinol methylase